MSDKKKLRCAIYTRKSSEEGLDQTFNSLDAQRAACEAYIASQASLGWRLAPGAYDDGGISGGTLERPSLQRLLLDIMEGRIDVVVVYKIDRLTRSLMDFAKLVDVFDNHAVSFVSVTQQFNTTTSMGRLTLNVLLSFAQFEREVTAERIRDKIAASKQKGLWMGGHVPVGYVVKDRKLIIDPGCALRIRYLFDRYLELGSVSALAREINSSGGLRPQAMHDPEACFKTSAAKTVSAGHLRHILANPIYIGKLRHKDLVHQGEHQAIVEPAIFNEVQRSLAARNTKVGGGGATPDIHLLTGLIFDETGDKLSPTHARRGARRYRYYVSHRLLAKLHLAVNGEIEKQNDGWRISAGELERIILQHCREILEDQLLIARLLDHNGDTRQIACGVQNALKMAAKLETNSPVEQKECLRNLFDRVILSPTSIRYRINKPALTQTLLGGRGDQQANQETVKGEGDPDGDGVTIERSIGIKRRGIEARLVIPGGSARAPDASLVELIGRAHLYLTRLTDGTIMSIGELASALDVHRAEISRILPLAFLSPQITDAILTGRQPADLTVRTLSRQIDIPASWAEQADLLGL
jgi:DNA invertase Pin-like site-specific DNA recombinase